MTNYKLDTYANGYGLWRCKITYPIALGNTGEAQVILHNSRRAAMRAIRRELTQRQGTPVKRLRYKITAGGQTSTNRISWLTLGEA
jgi:hypothetical protein